MNPPTGHRLHTCLEALDCSGDVRAAMSLTDLPLASSVAATLAEWSAADPARRIRLTPRLPEMKPIAWRWKQRGRTDKAAWSYGPLPVDTGLSTEHYQTELVYGSVSETGNPSPKHVPEAASAPESALQVLYLGKQQRQMIRDTVRRAYDEGFGHARANRATPDRDGARGYDGRDTSDALAESCLTMVERVAAGSSPTCATAPLTIQTVLTGDLKLPCDVLVAPGTRIGKGCTLSTLMKAIGHRTTVPDGTNLSLKPAKAASVIFATTLAQAWERFAASYDHESSAWIDMSADDLFQSGFAAAAAAASLTIDGSEKAQNEAGARLMHMLASLHTEPGEFNGDTDGADWQLPPMTPKSGNLPDSMQTPASTDDVGEVSAASGPTHALNASVGARIRLLVWAPHGDASHIANPGSDGLLFYEITEADGAFSLRISGVSKSPNFRSLRLAKAAAQRHFEHFIYSGLQPDQIPNRDPFVLAGRIVKVLNSTILKRRKPVCIDAVDLDLLGGLARAYDCTFEITAVPNNGQEPFQAAQN